jgi:phosphomannomutase
MALAALKQKAAAWLEKDPDERTQAQLRDLIDQDDREALEQAFSQRMSFGTAGLRGLMGVGPNNMNVSMSGDAEAILCYQSNGQATFLQRLVIRETTAGLANFLHKARLEISNRQRVVIAYDGRHGSYDCKLLLCAFADP